MFLSGSAGGADGVGAIEMGSWLVDGTSARGDGLESTELVASRGVGLTQLSFDGDTQSSGLPLALFWRTLLAYLGKLKQ